MPGFQIFPEPCERGSGPYLWGDAVTEDGVCNKEAMFLRSHKMTVFNGGGYGVDLQCLWVWGYNICKELVHWQITK